MRKHFKKYFIPHEENEYRPHILREAAVTVLALLALAAFIVSGVHTRLLLENADFLAAVLPDVLVDLANEDRANNGLTALSMNAFLEEAAQLKANHMAEHSYFAHVSPDGITPWHWFILSGYEFVAAGENLAVNFADSEDVEDAWMDSPGHRANILNGDFTEIGIATAQGEYKGQDTVFVVQLFGRPSASEVVQVPDDVAETPTETAVEQEPIVASEATTAPEPETVVEVVEVPETLEVTREDNMFLAVRDTAAEDAENGEASEDSALAGVEAVGLVVPETTPFERFVSQPKSALEIFYIVLAAVVLIALILNIVVEIEHHHAAHTAYGILLLVLILSLAYISRNFIFAELLII